MDFDVKIVSAAAVVIKRHKRRAAEIFLRAFWMHILRLIPDNGDYDAVALEGVAAERTPRRSADFARLCASNFVACFSVFHVNNLFSVVFNHLIFFSTAFAVYVHIVPPRRRAVNTFFSTLLHMHKKTFFVIYFFVQNAQKKPGGAG